MPIGFTNGILYIADFRKQNSLEHKYRLKIHICSLKNNACDFPARSVEGDWIDVVIR